MNTDGLTKGDANLDVMGFDVCTLAVGEIVAEIKREVRLTSTVRSRWLACINPHSFVVAKKDRQFALALRQADWLIPDGVGFVVAAKILHKKKLVTRVTGSDIFTSVMKSLNSSESRSVFFIGSSQETLMKIRKKVNQDYPNILVAGCYSPPFKDNFSCRDLGEMRRAINEARPDVLWVGMSAPKQEKWIFENIDQLDTKFIAAVGAVFDFYCANVKRPSRFWRSIGLEWLVRLLAEPKRLWRRTLISGPSFLIELVFHKLRRN